MARLGVSLLAAGQDTGVATPEPRKGACHEFLNDHREGRGGNEHLITRTAFIFFKGNISLLVTKNCLHGFQLRIFFTFC